MYRAARRSSGPGLGSLELRAAGPTTNRERRAPAGPAAAERTRRVGPASATCHRTPDEHEEKLNQHGSDGPASRPAICAGGVARVAASRLCVPLPASAASARDAPCTAVVVKAQRWTLTRSRATRLCARARPRGALSRASPRRAGLAMWRARARQPNGATARWSSRTVGAAARGCHHRRRPRRRAARPASPGATR